MAGPAQSLTAQPADLRPATMQHAAPTAQPASAHQHAGAHDARAGAATTIQATSDIQAKRRIFLEQVMSGTSRLQDIATAKREGWTRITGGDAATIHVINDASTRDGRALDPSRPEVLIYRRDGERWALIGAMFMAGSDGPINDKDGLPLATHTHGGQNDTSGHVWFTPQDLDTAYGDRGDPPDQLMGALAFTRDGAGAIRGDAAGIEATKRAFEAV